MVLGLNACDFSKEIIKSKECPEISKFNKYLEVVQTSTGWINLNLDSYFDEYGEVDEFNIPDDIRQVGVMPISKNCKQYIMLDEALEYSKEEPSFAKADELMKTLAPKEKQMLETTVEIYEYYSKQSYMDDDGKKGLELHKKIHSEYDEYDALLFEFCKTFSNVSRESTAKGLEKLKAADSMMRYHSVNIMIKSLESQMLFYDDSFQIDINKFEALQNSMIEDIDKFLEYENDDKRLKKEGLKEKAFLGRFLDDCENLKSISNNIVIALREYDNNNSSTGKISFYDAFSYIDEYEEALTFIRASYDAIQ